MSHKKIKLKLDLHSPLLKREVALLLSQSGVIEIVEEEHNLILCDTTETTHENNAVIDFRSFSFPVDFFVLKTAIENAFLKKEQTEGRVLMMGAELELNRYERSLIFLPNNQEISLTEKEIAMLEMLYANQGALVSKEDLLQKVWRYHAESETHTIETHIYRLRQKITDILGDVELILTDVNGYKINPDFLN